MDELDGSEVTNMTRITATFMKNLLNQVDQEGMVELATAGALGTLGKDSIGETKLKGVNASNKKKKTRR